jgi:serine/threonine protein kinase
LHTHNPSRTERLRFFDELLSAVQYLHSLRIAHLDIKPDNVLASDSGHAKLIDFSFAAFSFGPITDHSCGSLGYIAPEILAHSEFDGLAADVFSLGVCLYSLFTGRVPSDDTREFRQSRVNYRGIDGDIAGLIASMVGLDPSARPTVAQVREHSVFAELFGRPSGSRTPDVESPVETLDDRVFRKLANIAELEMSFLSGRVAEVGANREKVLYALAVGAFDRQTDDAAVISEMAMSKSLPNRGALSSECPFCIEDCWAMEVRESQAVVVSVIVQHMLARKFVVSMTASGSREFILNQAGDDITLEVEVSPVTDPANSFVVLRGRDGCAMEELQHFLEGRRSSGSR